MKLHIDLHRIQHVGVPVTGLGRSCDFYASLGFEAVMTSTFPHPEGTGHVCMMRRGEITLELYELPSPVLDEVRARRNGHIDHVAFDVADIDATFHALKSAGFEIAEPEPVYLAFWKNGCRYFNLIGPDGERLEFNQVL